MPNFSVSNMPEYLSDDEIHEYLDTCSTASLPFSLLEAINEYLLGDYGKDFDEEKYRRRRHCYYHSYHLYKPYALAKKLPWWKQLYWRFKKVDHPDSSTPEPLLEVIEWFELQGKTYLYNHLSDGSYRAYGFIERRTQGAKRVPIPFNSWGFHMLETNIDWVNSSIKADGTTYVGVQIVPAEALMVDPFGDEDTGEGQTLSLNAPATASKTSDAGRPTARKAILQAYGELCDEGKIDFSISLKKQTPLIQERVRSLLSDEDKDRLGYEYEAIRRLVCSDFNSKRVKKKTSSKL